MSDTDNTLPDVQAIMDAIYLHVYIDNNGHMQGVRDAAIAIYENTYSNDDSDAQMPESMGDDGSIAIPDILPVLGDIPSPDPIVKQYSEDEDNEGNKYTTSVYGYPNSGLAHDTAAQARSYARKFPGLWVYIVESRGKYYVDGAGFLRSWEVVIHEGYGKYA